MAKLTRVTAKIFGETADATLQDPEIGQFGSAKAGTYNGTGDVATIQSLSAWSNGWIDAVTPTQQFPPLPEMTGVHKVLSYQNAYLLQQGIAEWDSATNYYTNGFCSKGGKIYKSTINDNLNNDPELDTVSWEEVRGGLTNIRNDEKLDYWVGTRSQYDAIVTKDANTIYNITDDTDVTLTLLNLLYPVGSLYIASGNLSTCPLSVLGVGTWALKTTTTLVTGVNSTAPVVGGDTAMGFKSGSYYGGLVANTGGGLTIGTNVYGNAAGSTNTNWGNSYPNNCVFTLTDDPTKSGIKANITSTTLAVTIWERIS